MAHPGALLDDDDDDDTAGVEEPFESAKREPSAAARALYAASARRAWTLGSHFAHESG